MIIEAVRNHVIFQFVDEIRGERFVNRAASGIEITSGDLNQAQLPRWGKATNVGPDTVGVKAGDYILIESGKWTTQFNVGSDRFWKTDDECIICTSDEPGTSY